MTNLTTREEELEKFFEITTAKNARRTLMKLYFHTDREVLTEDDHEEVYLMYNLLESVE